MTNIIDYALWRGDLPCVLVGLCPVDFLVFAQLIHAPLERLEGVGEGKRLSALTAAVYPEVPGKDENALVHSRYELWNAMKDGARFGDVTLKRFTAHFEPEEEKQFAAALFVTGDGTGVVAFRGTDATLVGWKEDFNMSFESPVPSQREAVAFLEEAARLTEVRYVCGHSKGGNLAMYAAAMCVPQVRAGLKGVYSFDGPGLDDATLAGEGWQEVESRVHSYVPESSIIGLLMGYREEYTIVRSDSVSLWQHNPYYWHVLGPAFLTAQDTTLSSQFANRTLHGFLSGCTPGQRRVLVDTLYSVLSASGARTLKELPRGMAAHLDEVAAALRAVPAADRQVAGELLGALVEAGGDSAGALWKGWLGRLEREE